MLLESILIGGVVAWLGSSPSPSPRLKRLRRAARARALKAQTNTTPVVAETAPDPMRQIDSTLMVMGATLTAGVIGTLVAPPLMTVALGVHFGMMGPIILRDLYQSVIVKRRAALVLLDVILISLMLGTGRFLASMFGCTLYLISRKLVLKTEDHSKKDLNSLFGEQQATVWIKQGEIDIEIPIEQLNPGDLVVVNAGDVIPVDGVVAAGTAAVDQRALTGEAQPIDVEPNAAVFASTIVLSGRLEIEVERSGPETVALQLREILLKTADIKTTMHSRGEQIADSTAAPAIAVGGAAALIGMPAGQILALMNANFGYNMRFLAPILMLRHLAAASRSGVLVKDGRALELLIQVDTVVFDKTGTLTEEQPTLSAAHTFGDLSGNEVIRLAAAAEQTQKHPIARAIKAAAHERGLAPAKAAEARYVVGFGLEAAVEGRKVLVGSRRFMSLSHIALSDEAEEIFTASIEKGASLVAVAVDGVLAGLLELRAVVRPEAFALITALRQRGVREIHIISGDQTAPTRAIAEALGVDDYFAETPPEEKAAIVKRLQDKGRIVCFVGDGINDSIALRQAHVSISLSGASTIATDTASIVMMDGDLQKLPEAFDNARSAQQALQRSFYTTMIPGVICIGGVMMFNLGIVGTMVINQAGLIAGLSNVALKRSPALEQDQTPKHKLGSF